MISAIQLGNFKAFGQTQRIPLRPITLLYGPNSAGKSSIIHSLALADEICRSSDLDVQRTELGGDSIELGGFRQFVFQRDLSNFIELGLDIDFSDLPDSLVGIMEGIKKLSLSVKFGCDVSVSEENPLPKLYSFKVDLNGINQFQIKWKDNLVSIDEFNFKNPYFVSDCEGFINAFSIKNKDLFDEKILHENFQKYIKEIKISNEGIIFPNNIDMNTDISTIFNDLIGRREVGTEKLMKFQFHKFLTRVLIGLNEIVKYELCQLRYLDPLRSLPPRHLALLDNHDPNWLKGEGKAWSIIMRDSKVRSKINKWLGEKGIQTRYQLGTKQFIVADEVQQQMRKSVNEAKGYLAKLNSKKNGNQTKNLESTINNILKDTEQKIEESKFPDIYLKDLNNGTVVSHRDVGIGVSQVLPVLVSAFGNKNSTICIEQPEIHLHPALQSRLGDLFINSALGGQKNSFIIETHSEYLILRILRRIRETANGKLPKGMTKVSPEDVSVLYCDPSKKGTKIVELPVTDDGDFSRQWPNGFFEDRIPELFDV